MPRGGFYHHTSCDRFRHQTTVDRISNFVNSIIGIDPLSVVTFISLEQDVVQITLKHKEENQSQPRLVTLTVKPKLEQSPKVSEQELATIQGCSFSTTCDNMIIKLIKMQSLEWQSLEVHTMSRHVKGTKQSGESSMDIEPDEHSESIVRKFVTKTNATLLQSTIRTEQMWEDVENGQLRVGNIQAKKISEMNAIQMTAELVGESPAR
ncbi:hypothetical protein BGX27_003650 [Mortierella sp. AM989]|nr:hypothetical protein BGX27_003650 [Mortierella sp. AM989]